MIAGGTYRNIAEDATTVAVKATLVTVNTMDVDTVYNITKALFESKDEFTHEKASYIDMAYAMGIFALSASLEGYVFRHMAWPLRIISAAAGLMMIGPNTLTDVIGILIICAVLFIQYIGAKRQRGSKVTA